MPRNAPRAVQARNQRNTPSEKGRPDMRLLYLTIGLVGFGILMVYSSSAVLAFYEDRSPFHYFILQIVWVVIGTVCAYVAYKIPLKLLPKTSFPIMMLAIILLVVLLFVGKNLNGATRWIDLGPFDLQPSEIAKLAFVIYLSAWLSKPRVDIKDFKEKLQHHIQFELLPFMMLMLIVCGLIVLQPDLDTALIIAATSLTIYFVSGRDRVHTVGSLFIVLSSGVIALFAALRANYRLARITAYLDFLRTGKFEDAWGSGFQVYNGLVAIGSGGLFGLGFTQSRQKFYYLYNAAFTDSIFAVIAEEFGLIGSVALILAFLYFMSLGVNIARRANDRFSALLAMGITTWITIQAFLNIGANLAIIPFGGIPLPFLSYGGSNTIIILVAVGLLLNVSRNTKSS